MKKMNAAVVVVGAGTAGAISAIASSRLGLNTIVVEQTGSIGGVAVNALMGSFANLMISTKMEPMVGGIVKELVRRIVEASGTPYQTVEEAILGKIQKPFTIPFSPVLYEHTLLEMLEEADVKILLNTDFLTGERKESGLYRIRVVSGTQQMEINAKVVIDATGNAIAAKELGAEIRIQPETTFGCLMRVGNVHIAETLHYIRDRRPWISDPDYEKWVRVYCGLTDDMNLGRLSHFTDPLHYDHAPMKNLADNVMNQEKWAYIEERFAKEGIVYTLELSLFRYIVKQAIENGDFFFDLPMGDDKGITYNGDGIAYGAWGGGVALCNVAKPYGFDASDAEESTQAALLAKKYNVTFSKFLKKYVPGFENSFLLDMGSQTVCRAEQMIVGCDDEQYYKKNSLYKEPIYTFGGIYDHQLGVHVPYGKIVSANCDNIFAIGKCASHGEKYRSQISCMSMGIAAAAASKIICREGCNSHSIMPEQLRKQLADADVYIKGQGDS